MMNIKQRLILARDLKDIYRKRPITTAGNISYANWWEEDPEKAWFTRFIRYHFPDCRTPVRFYSVFGRRENIREKFSGIKIFYSGENIEERVHYSSLTEREEKAAGWDHRISSYADNALPDVELSMAFGYRTEENYLRLPLWVQRYFPPEADLKTVREQTQKLNRRKIDLQRTGAALIASHDFMGTRAAVCDGLGDIVSIDYAGKWRHNTDRLWAECGNDKEKFLSHYRFNICPENMDASGYVTEKLFDAFAAGCIPVYHGSLGNPEPGIVSPDAYIPWRFDADNEKSRELVRRLLEDDGAFEEYAVRPLFTQEAAELIYEGFFLKLKTRLEDLLK